MEVRLEQDVLWVSFDTGKYRNICQGLHLAELKEATYKDVVAKIDNDFLQQKLRAAALEGVKLSGVQDKSLVFDIRSANFHENNTVYVNLVRLKEWDDFIDESTLTPIQRARQLMYNGNLDLHCTCPSFLFWGYQYLLTQIDAALVPETRPPVVRNPAHRGIVCKHLHRTLKAFPFYAGDFARYIKANHVVTGGKTGVADNKSKMANDIRMNPDTDVKYSDVI